MLKNVQREGTACCLESLNSIVLLSASVRHSSGKGCVQKENACDWEARKWQVSRVPPLWYPIPSGTNPAL